MLNISSHQETPIHTTEKLLHPPPFRMAKLKRQRKKISGSKNQDVEKLFLPVGGSARVQSLWNPVWPTVPNVKIEFLNNPAIPLPCIYPRVWKANIHVKIVD